MAQFIVYENTNRRTKNLYPYLLDVQADLLDDLKTTVVIPLSLKSMAGNVAITKLCPLVEMNDNEYIAFASQIAGIERNILGKQISDLSHYRSEVISAIDFIISGI